MTEVHVDTLVGNPQPRKTIIKVTSHFYLQTPEWELLALAVNICYRYHYSAMEGLIRLLN